MFILFALLPLAANAACGPGVVDSCAKCGVGIIAQQFDWDVPCKFSGVGFIVKLIKRDETPVV